MRNKSIKSKGAKSANAAKTSFPKVAGYQKTWCDRHGERIPCYWTGSEYVIDNGFEYDGGTPDHSPYTSLYTDGINETSPSVNAANGDDSFDNYRVTRKESVKSKGSIKVHKRRHHSSKSFKNAKKVNTHHKSKLDKKPKRHHSARSNDDRD